MTDSINNGIVKYSSRDYESILNDFWSVVPTLTENWVPDSDSDPGVVLSKFVASCADMLSTNLDLLANEVYAPSVSQRKNAEKIFSLIGYDLGWWKASTTEVTFTNNTGSPVTLDFGFNGSNFSTLNAYTDITNEERTITYNILPGTSSYSDMLSRSTRSITTSTLNVFTDTDIVTLSDGDSCTRVAVEGELRSYNISVADVKANRYIITLPSQHVDTTKVWVKAKSSLSSESFLDTQWVQCANTSEFIIPEPRFAVTYDNYSNAQITVSNYLNQLENYESNYLVIYWIDCSGVIGCVGEDVLTNLLMSKTQPVAFNSGDITVSNLSNIVELPNTFTVTGASPETAREAYLNSRNFINTSDSLITLPDFNRFLNREPGIDCGVVIDCQKALQYNLSVYNNSNLSESQKSKMYITNYDFPAGPDEFDWQTVLDIGFDPSDPKKFIFSANFKRYTAMCFGIHNDFKDSSYGRGQVARAKVKNSPAFMRYKLPDQLITGIINDYKPLQAMTVDLDFGFARIFNFYITGVVYLTSPVSADVGQGIINTIKDQLALYFAPANREFGVAPTVIEVIDVIKKCDNRISYFDGGSLSTDIITWSNCDPEYFNIISFAKYSDIQPTSIQIAPTSLIN